MKGNIGRKFLESDTNSQSYGRHCTKSRFYWVFSDKTTGTKITKYITCTFDWLWKSSKNNWKWTSNSLKQGRSSANLSLTNLNTQIMKLWWWLLGKVCVNIVDSGPHSLHETFLNNMAESNWTLEKSNLSRVKWNETHVHWIRNKLNLSQNVTGEQKCDRIYNFKCTYLIKNFKSYIFCNSISNSLFGYKASMLHRRPHSHLPSDKIVVKSLLISYKL